MKILAINKNYIPVRVVSIYNAIGKLYTGMAEAVIVENNNYFSYSFDEWLEMSIKDRWPEDQKFINSVRQRIAYPSIIRYVKYDKIPKATLKLTRTAIYQRDDYHCYICGKQFGTSKLSVDHIKPLSKGGRNEWTNLITCCVECNWRKGDKLLSELSIKPKFEAYKPNTSNIARLKSKITQSHQDWVHFGL